MTTTNGSTSTTSVLDDHLSLISITVGTGGGYRCATREAITKLGGNLPSCKAITEGSLKVFPSEPLAIFQSIRRGLFRKMQKRGIKALGSSNVFGIPRADLEEAEKEIAEAEREFATALADLDVNHDVIFEKHVADNPEAEEIIREKKFSKAETLGKLHFSSAVFRIQPEIREGQDSEQGVQGIVEGLGRQLFEEVAEDMQRLLKNDAFTTKHRAGQKTLRPLQTVVRKMAGLVFLDERSVKGVIQLINDTLVMLPKQGYIEDTGMDLSFSTLRRLVETLADADDLVNAAGKICNGIPAKDVLFPPPPVVQAPVVQQAIVQPVTTSQPTPAATVDVKPASSLPIPPASLPPLPVAAANMVMPPPPAPMRSAVPMF